MKEKNIRFVLTILLLLLLLSFYFNYKAYERIEEIDNSIYSIQLNEIVQLPYFNNFYNYTDNQIAISCNFLVDYRFKDNCEKDIKDYINETKDK